MWMDHDHSSALKIAVQSVLFRVFCEPEADFQPCTLAPNEVNLKARSFGSGCSSTLRTAVHLWGGARLCEPLLVGQLPPFTSAFSEI